ncbi:unnamed protein product, partial [Pylaiella littoralis]
ASGQQEDGTSGAGDGRTSATDYKSKWLALYIKWKAARIVAKRGKTRYRHLKNVRIRYVPIPKENQSRLVSIVVSTYCLRLTGEAGR